MTNDEYKDKFNSWAESIDPTYHAFRQGMVGPGWLPLLDECFFELKAAGWSGNILQIKEKFGSLRLYISGINPAISEIVNRCEERSRTICEECGQVGELRNDNGWLNTLCESHHVERLAARRNRNG